MPLTDTAVRGAKRHDKPYKLFDGGGLYLQVMPSGARRWRHKYRHEGKEKLLSLGVYPAVSLKQARERRDEERRLLARGIDPGVVRVAEKSARAGLEANTFEAVAREWFAKFKPTWHPSHSSKIIRRLERDIFPVIGSMPVGEVNAPHLLKALREIERRGALETAHRAHQNCGQILRYAVATGRIDRNPSADLRGALPPAVPEHHASITEPAAVGALLRAIDGYDGSPVTKCALRLAPLVFVRPSELRKAEWKEFDLEKGEWRIPAERMKMRELHIVPLSVQTIAILTELRPITGSDNYLFPGVRGRGRAMSENTVNAALRRLGYTSDQMTGHGFRSTASTLLNESGLWRHDAIERQLAHGERNQVRAAYNFAEHLPERRKMMQWWADYLDGLRREKVVAFRALA